MLILRKLYFLLKMANCPMFGSTCFVRGKLVAYVKESSWHWICMWVSTVVCPEFGNN